jgi:TP901 family phage tail tape measure protein
MANTFNFGIRLDVLGEAAATAKINAFTQSVTKMTKVLDQTSRAAPAATSGLAHVGQAASSFVNLAGAFTSLVVVKNVVQGLKAVIAPAIELDTALTRLQTITGATGAELKRFESAAFDAAAATKFNPKEAIDALVRLRQITGDTEQSIRMIKPTLVMAQASFNDLTPEKTVEMMGQLMKSFKMTGNEAKVAADKVYRMAKGGGLAIKDFSTVIGKLGTAGFMGGGQSLDDMLALFTMARQGGIAPERLGTETMAMMRDLTGPKVTAGMRAMGLSFKNLQGDVAPMREIFSLLTGEMMSRPTATMNMLNRAFGGTGAKVLIESLRTLTTGKTIDGKFIKGLELWDKLQEKARSGPGLAEAAEISMNSIGGVVERMNEAWQRFSLGIGKSLLPVLKPLAAAMLALGEGFAKIADNAAVQAVSGIAGSFLAIAAASWSIKAAWWGIGRILAVTKGNVGGLLSAFGGGGGAGVAKLSPAMLAMSAVEGPIMPGRVAAQRGLVPIDKTHLLGRAHQGLTSAFSSMKTAGKAAFGAINAAMGPVGWTIAGITASMYAFTKLLDYGREKSDWLLNDKKAEGSTLFKGLDFFTHGKMSELKVLNKQYLDARKVQIEQEKRLAKDHYEYLQLGSKELDERLSRMDKLINYKPEAVKMDVLASAVKMARRFSRGGAAGAGGGAYGEANINTLKGAMPYLREALSTLSDPDTTPAQYTAAMGTIAGLQTTLYRIGLGGHGEASRMARRLHENVLAPMRLSMTDAAIASNRQQRVWEEEGGGRERPPGTKGVAEEAQERAEGERRELFKERTKKEEGWWKEQLSYMSEQTRALKQITRGFSGQITAPDPPDKPTTFGPEHNFQLPRSR